MPNPTPAWRSLSPLWLAPLALAVATPLGLILGRGPFFISLAGFALIGVIWMFWQSLQSLTGEAPLSLDEALSLAAPNAEEERKVSVLRALKDLEYERSVGKIDEQDYQELSQRYRTEAKQLLQLVDDSLGPMRQRVLSDLEVHLQREGVVQNSAPAPKTDTAAPAATTENVVSEVKDA